MLSERALELNKKGKNCAECILIACQREYGVKFSEDIIAVCGVLNNGLGVGGCCGALLACIIVIAILCDNSRHCRLELVERFNTTFGSMNCAVLKRNDSCERIIEHSCNILADIIDKNRKK